MRWVSHDTLVSHSPSALFRDDPNEINGNRNTHPVPGEIVVWRWLGLDRFFPPLYDNMRADGQTQGVLRGCASVSSYPVIIDDYQAEIALRRIIKKAVRYSNSMRLPFCQTK